MPRSEGPPRQGSVHGAFAGEYLGKDSNIEEWVERGRPAMARA